MKTKNKLIEEYLSEPVKKGDNVTVMGLGIKNKSSWGLTAKVVGVLMNGKIKIEHHSSYGDNIVNKGDYKKYTGYIGYNPVIEKPWNSNLKMVNYTLESIIHTCGFDRKTKTLKTEEFKEFTAQYLNWNPWVLDRKGERVYYQRDFVWTMKDKQLLIESLYNKIDLGKIVLRRRSFDFVKKEAEKGEEVGFHDIVDGKQRLNAIIGFLSDEYPDLNNRYFSEFSDIAKHRLLDCQVLAYGELGESATDQDVKSVFLGINFTGVEMSQEHIDFVKDIQI